MVTRRTRKFFRQITVWFLLFCMFVNTAPVTLAISDGQFIAGVGTINRNGNTVTITASDGTIINWGNFDIPLDEIARFIQPGSNAAVLNKILSGAATHIDGALLANGRIFIVNPAGVIFGAGAAINVSQLVASGLNIRNEDFINGRYEFFGGNGSVINHGNISAETVALIGKHVLNTGVITSPNGYVVMVSGDRVLLGRHRSNIVVEVDSVQAPGLTDTGDIAADVINEGTISASGGTIVLASGDIFSKAIEGLDSLSVKVESGSGRVAQLGLLNADGAEGNGGNIVLSAGEVVSVGSDSLTTANAGTDGDGGDILVYSPDTALLAAGAQIEVKGGSNSGNGGFVEVSGHQHVEIKGSVNASARNGAAGTLLIDPTDITITNGPGDIDPGVAGIFTPSGDASTISDDAIEAFLNNGTNVQITTVSAGTGTGNIVQNADAMINAAMPNGTASLNMTADNNIELNGGIWGNLLDVILDAGGNVDVGAIIITNGGNIVSSGVGFDNTGGPLVTSGGNVDLSAHTGIVTIDMIHTLGGTSTGTVNINGSSISVNKITGKSDILLNSDSGSIGLRELQAGSLIQITSAQAIDDISGGTATNLKANNIDLTSVTGIGQSAVVTSQADVIDASTTGSPAHISITNTGDVTLDNISTINGSINITNAGDMTAGGLTAGGTGDIELVTTSGDVFTGFIDALDNKITINSAGAILKGAGVLDFRAADLVFEAVTGIGTNSFLVSLTNTISAKTTGTGGGADIAIENFSPITIFNMSTVDGSINISNKGNMQTGTISAGGAGNVSLSTVINSVDNSDIIVDKIMALDNTVTINSAGAIKKGTDFIAAKDLALEAVTGIGTNTFMVTLADTMSAKTTGAAGGADIAIENYTPVTLYDTSTVDGSINITNAGDMTTGGITAGGTGDIELVTTSGDILVGLLDAENNRIAITSAGAIEKATDFIRANDLILEAVTGIGTSTFMVTLADSISAKTTGAAGGADIAIENFTPVTLYDTSTVDGSINLANKGSIVTGSVSAGGAGNVSLSTVISGDVIVDDITALGNTITINSIGAIGEVAEAVEAVDLAAATLLLTANTGVQGSSPIETSSTDITITTDAGTIDVTNDNSSDSVASLTVSTGTGDILFGQTGGGKLELSTATTADGSIAIDVDNADLTAAGVVIAGNLGNIELTASASTIRLEDNVDAGQNLILNDNTNIAAGKMLKAGNDVTVADGKTLLGDGALTIDAGRTVTLGGDVATLAGELKVTGASAGLAVDIKGTVDVAGGNADIKGTGNVQIGGDIASDIGGVSIVSNNGKIFTRDGIADDTIKVNITGSSDDIAGMGIENAGGRTAILIKSKEDLKLDSGTLTANGTYYAPVDDRAAIDFLQADILSENKSAGVAIDVAIYLASASGSVHIGSAIENIGNNGAVAADAFNAVSYGGAFETSLAAGNIDHLEVSSRSALDYVDARDNSLLIEQDTAWNVGTYVWRGENPDAGTGAWVLEPPADSAPAAPVPMIRLETVQVREFDILGIELLAVTAKELGIPVEDIQTRLANALFLSTDVQPYDILEQLIAAARILRDSNGIVALGRVINEFVSTPAAPTEEQMALIASALSNPDSGTYYAQAGDYIDAMASYIGTLSEGLGWAQSDAVAFVMEKYGTAMEGTGDASLAAYVQVRLSNLGG